MCVYVCAVSDIGGMCVCTQIQHGVGFRIEVYAVCMRMALCLCASVGRCVCELPLHNNRNMHANTRAGPMSPADHQNDAHSLFKDMNMYDDSDAAPGCLPWTKIVQNMRTFSVMLLRACVCAKVCAP